MRSLLQGLVNGTRQMLAVQLVLSILLIALAGWTLTITNETARERDALRDRVVQLEQMMAQRGEIPPPPPVAVVASGQSPYPGSIAQARTIAGEAEALSTDARDLGDYFDALFAPAPPISTVVLHVRTADDGAVAEQLAQSLHANAQIRTAVRVMASADTNSPGYVYFDGRQNRAAAALVARVHDTAREAGVAAWAAQIQGVALPAQGEYSADRLDIVLPPLPAPTPTVAAAPITAPR